MTLDNCKSTPSQIAKLIPQDDCNCEDSSNNGSCNCDLTDLKWKYAIGACMALIGIESRDTQKTIDIKFANYMCTLKGLIDDIDSDFDCSDIKVPASYPGFDYVGTEHTAVYDLSTAVYAGNDQIIIDGVSYDVSAFDQGQLVGFINALNLGTFVASGTDVTVTDYHDYGVLTINGTDFTPTVTDTANIKNLCAALSFISAKLSTIQDTNILYSAGGVTTGGSGSYEDLQTYVLEAGTLANDGDELIIELCSTANDSSDNAIGKDCRVAFNGIGIGDPFGCYAYAGSFPIDYVVERVRIKRLDNTTVWYLCEINLNYINSGNLAYQQYEATRLLPTAIGGLNLTTTDYDIVAQAKALTAGKTITSKLLTIRIERA